MPRDKGTPLQINLKIEDIYKALCPQCKEELLRLAAQSGALDAIKSQLKAQWKK